MANKTYKVRKQEIDSLIQNLAWETDPNWEIKLQSIRLRIHDFWKNELKRKYNEFR